MQLLKVNKTQAISKKCRFLSQTDKSQIPAVANLICFAQRITIYLDKFHNHLKPLFPQV